MRSSRYRPLDTTLDQLSVRLLRALRHFDDAGMADLAVAMSEPDTAAFDPALKRHLKRGRIERVDRGERHPHYRITDAGKRWLDGLLKRGESSTFWRAA